MRRIVLFALLLLPAPLQAADFDPKPLEAVVELGMKELDVPGAAVVIVHDDKIIYCKGFGVREKGKPELVTVDTVFAIASCSKAFTATLVGMLVDDGKLKWDDKVRDHLDFFQLTDPLADREVTLRDLLSHRTGMPRHDFLWFANSVDASDFIHRWGRGKPSTSFRSTWEYTNGPFTTAGFIAGQLEKSDWSGAVQKRIFDPLQMKSSSTTWKAGSSGSNHATPHIIPVGKSTTPIKWTNADSVGGAGSINSTATDMGNWLRFQLAGGKFNGTRLIAESTLKETHSPQMLFKLEGGQEYILPPKATRFSSYGLGWNVHDYRGYDCVSHGGQFAGVRAQCVMIPNKKFGVFVVSNANGFFVEAVANTAVDQFLGLPAEDWVKHFKEAWADALSKQAVAKKKREDDRKPNTKPSLELKAYASSYDEPAYGRAEVTVADDKLMMKWGSLTFRLDHYHFDTFTAVAVAPADEVIRFESMTLDLQFRLNTAGAIEGLKFLDQDFKKSKK